MNTRPLPEAVVALLKSAPQWNLATCDMEPNVVPFTFKTITPDGRLAFANNYMETTVANIQKNGRAAVSAHNGETREGYQIKGAAEYVTEGPVYEAMAAVVTEKTHGRMTPKGVVLVTPEHIIVTTPGADNKKEL